MAAPDRAPPPPVIEDFPPSRPGVKFLGLLLAIVAGVVILVFRQQVMAAIGMG
jgi:hypothetical protein